MPRVAASNGIRPEIRALAVFKVGVPVTPAQINDHVGTGEYAAKYVSFLNTRYGFTITTQKDGRRVVSYTMVSEPANAAELRGAQPKHPKAKTPKAAAPKKTVKLSTIVEKVSKEFKTPKAAPAPTPAKKVAKQVSKKSVADIKAANLAKLKAVGAKFKKDQVQMLTEEVPATSFSLDNDWDSIDGLDLSKLL